MRNHFAIALMLAVSTMLLAGCMEKVGEAMLMSRGPERMEVLSAQVEKEPLSKRYEYLSTSEDYEMVYATVWSFWNDTPINDAKTVEMLMKNLERWRNPATPRMRKTMKKARGYGNFYSLQSATISSLRYIYEFTESQEVKKSTEDTYTQYHDSRSKEERKYVERPWRFTGQTVEKEYRKRSNKPTVKTE